MRWIGMLAAAVASAATFAGSGAAAIPKLQGSVSDPSSISLTFGGKKASTLKAGRYLVVVKDLAADHNFHLTGPGLNRSTTTGGTGTWTWNVTLRKGTYTYVCDTHALFMKGSFTVR